MLFNVTEPYSTEKEKIREAFTLAATGKELIKGSRPGTFKYVNLTWPLPNMKPSTEKEFWGFRQQTIFSAEIWEQFQIDGTRIAVLIYFVNREFNGPGGFAVVPRRDRVEYYKWIACEHEFERTRVGKCLTDYTCLKCGHKFQLDSSD